MPASKSEQSSSMDTVWKWAYAVATIVAGLAGGFGFRFDILIWLLMLIGVLVGLFYFDPEELGEFGLRVVILYIVKAGLSAVPAPVGSFITGFFGGWVDTGVSRAIDIVLSLPILLLAIGIAAACSITATGCLGGLIQPGISLVVAIIALFSWPYIGRIVRGQVLSIREKEFIEASRSLGFTNAGIMFREILPNLAAPVIVYTTLIIPNNILFEAALSFLGVGIPQTTPSWGRMIADAAAGQLYTVAWWMLLFPGMALVFATLAFNLVGDGLRDALDPRMGG